MNNDRIVQCTNCEFKHKWFERKIIQSDGWTLYLCPQCDDESIHTITGIELITQERH